MDIPTIFFLVAMVLAALAFSGWFSQRWIDGKHYREDYTSIWSSFDSCCSHYTLLKDCFGPSYRVQD